MTTITFKTIPQYPDLEISNCGTIIRKIETPDRVLPISITGTGYSQFTPGDKRPAAYVHRCVLSAHDRLPDDGEVARHLNDDRTDNRLENLSWGTHSENMADRLLNGGHHIGNIRLRPRPSAPEIKTALCALHDPDDVRELRRLHWIEGVTQCDLADMYGIKQPTVSRIVNFQTYIDVIGSPEVERFRLN